MKQEHVLGLYEQAGALLNGHFILSSGRHSAQYLQSALVLMHPEKAAELASSLIKLLDGQTFDMVVSPALGGLVIGHEVARLLAKPFIFTERKEGVMQLRRGFTLAKNARLLIVEDVITTGGSVRECMAVVRKHGATPIQVLALVDRAAEQQERFDIPHQTVINIDVETFAPEQCPMCAKGIPAIKPGSRGAA
ncbi:MAG: orotate phosphoribosyltransferase [Mariprofundaceae bacterium]|nr:orotate phosphoribosyltransferase [Mariprofundaceae bacterium]